MPRADARFQHPEYLFRKKVFKFLGGAFHIYGPSEELLFYSKQKAFKLKEDIRVFSDESEREEVLTIKARQILDFSAAYDVVDPGEGVAVGALRRKGWSSLVRDEWELLDVAGQVIGKIQEDSMGMALLRRFLSNLIPQAFTFVVGGAPVAEIRQLFNPFVLKYTLRWVGRGMAGVDPRLALAAGILLCAIEGRQD